MFELILDSLIDALKDGALSVPILFLSYLFMEWLERSEKLNEEILSGRSKKAGPLIGGLLGAVPQCGISGASAALFSTGTISLGTMLAVFFATSDEMLPVLLTELGRQNGVSALVIIRILLGKILLGVVLGYLADLIFSKLLRPGKDIHSFCERENCDCDEDGNIFIAALKHTLKIALILIITGFVLNFLLSYAGADALSGTVLNRPVVGELLLALFGLIPNCSVSVAITQAWISGIIGTGGLFAGLLSNAGMGLIVLFRTNRNMRENFLIVLIMLVLSFLSGSIVGLIF